MYIGKVKGTTIRLSNKTYANLVRRFNPEHAVMNERGEYSEYIISIPCHVCIRLQMDCSKCPFKVFSTRLGCLIALRSVINKSENYALNVGDKRISWMSTNSKTVKAGMKKVQRVLEEFKKEV